MAKLVYAFAQGKADGHTGMKDLLGLDIAPAHADPRPGDVRESLADITRARHKLNYESLVGFEEGLRRSIDYYRGLAGSKKSQ